MEYCKVGALLAMVMDRLDDGRVVVEAVPAIDVDDDAGAGKFTRSAAAIRGYLA